MTTPLKIESEKFTPGPWETYESIRGTGGEELLDESYNGVYALLGYFSDDPATGFSLTGCISKADARLIAAAPEMYEALKAVEEANQIGSWGPAMNKVRAALAKAVKP